MKTFFRKIAATVWFFVAKAFGKPCTQSYEIDGVVLTFVGFQLFGLMAYNKTIISRVDPDDRGVRH